MKMRVSRLPLAILCPPSLEVGMIIGGDRKPAGLGTAGHEALAICVDGDQPDLARIAFSHEVELAQLSKIFHFGRQSWEQLKKYFPNPETEVYMEWEGPNSTLTGHADVLSLYRSRLGILDFKSGFLDTDAEAQLRGYAFLAFKRHPEADTCYAVLLRIRDFKCHAWTWTREEIEAWWETTEKRLLNDKEFRPAARHCVHCPRGPSCPAKTQLIQQAANSLLDPPVLTLPEDPYDRGQFWADVTDRCNLIEDEIEKIRDMRKVDLTERGGTLPTRDGREVVLVKGTKREIILERAARILVGELGSDALMKILSLSVGDLEKAISDSVGTGQKGKQIKAVFEELDEAGAIARHETSKVVLKLTRLAIPEGETR